MPTDQEQLERAKALIKAKQYSKARRILEPLNHPTAEKWLAKLDDIDPFPADEPAPKLNLKKTPAKPQPKRATRRDIILVIAAVISIPIIIIGVLTFHNTGLRANEIRLQVRLYSYCIDLTIEVGAPLEPCSDWSRDSWSYTEDAVTACDKLSPELDAPFNECLIDEDILPPGVVRRR